MRDEGQLVWPEGEWSFSSSTSSRPPNPLAEGDDAGVTQTGMTTVDLLNEPLNTKLGSAAMPDEESNGRGREEGVSSGQITMDSFMKPPHSDSI